MLAYYRQKDGRQQIILENGFCVRIYEDRIEYKKYASYTEASSPCPDRFTKSLEVDDGLAEILQGVCEDKSKPKHIYEMRVKTLAQHVLKDNN